MDHFCFFYISCLSCVLSVHCSLVVTCWKSADLLALSYVMFYCVFVTFPCGVLGQVLCSNVSIPDLCLLFTFSAAIHQLVYKLAYHITLTIRFSDVNALNIHYGIYFFYSPN